MFANFFFSWKSGHLWDNVQKYGGAIQATDYNAMQHRKDAICLLVK